MKNKLIFSTLAALMLVWGSSSVYADSDVYITQSGASLPLILL